MGEGVISFLSLSMRGARAADRLAQPRHSTRRHVEGYIAEKWFSYSGVIFI